MTRVEPASISRRAGLALAATLLIAARAAAQAPPDVQTIV
jgi:hypothetical protein